ncbi:hypothetical protein Pan153_17720 [Gimesia panareensis]|uniref:Uncharacterized protein n=1 Tax=Gimesia panareensis TaxID=2527978 RepID=A0A518FLH2_9PLAN|nr:hypothetical protein Pan153_17720 [Gimesia panareensis]
MRVCWTETGPAIFTMAHRNDLINVNGVLLSGGSQCLSERFPHPGTSYVIETDYVFGRKFEWEPQTAEPKINNILLLHSGIRC